jgi:cytoskeletal protein CcmA (bactofilin family)
MSTESSRSSKGVIGRAASLLKRNQRPLEGNWRTIVGYHVGDIMSDEPILVDTGSAIAGNVAAPELVVQGLIYGFAAAKELGVEAGGQIWGDVYCTDLLVANGGKVHGWISTLDHGTVDMLRGGDLSASDLRGVAGTTDLPLELGVTAERMAAEDEEVLRWVAIWRQLQAEAAVAIMARRELESRFDVRVAELASEAVAEATVLRQELQAAQSQVAAQPARVEAGERPAPVLGDSEKLHKLQLALKRSMQRSVQLETAVEYWRALAQEKGRSGQPNAINAGQREQQPELPESPMASEVGVGVQHDQPETALWGRLSQSVANAQLAHCQALLQAQGERVAELQAALAERDVALDQARAEVAEQVQRLDRFGKLAASRIAKLEAAVKSTGRAGG